MRVRFPHSPREVVLDTSTGVNRRERFDSSPHPGQVSQWLVNHLVRVGCVGSSPILVAESGRGSDGKRDMRKRISTVLMAIALLMAMVMPAQAARLTCSHPDQGIHVYQTTNSIIGSRLAHAVSTLPNGNKRVQVWSKSSWLDPTWDYITVLEANC